MKEEEWRQSIRADSMVAHLTHGRGTRPTGVFRRYRLFFVACCKLGSHLLAKHPEVWACLEFAEGDADDSERSRSTEIRRSVVTGECHRWRSRQKHQVGQPPGINDLARIACEVCDPEFRSNWSWSIENVLRALSNDGSCNHPEAANLLRCIFGNPFRPVAFDPRWRSETAIALATGIYESRAFDRLPILADALEEAGCDHVDVLSHCRQPDAPHARGCWVVDGVLGKG